MKKLDFMPSLGDLVIANVIKNVFSQTSKIYWCFDFFIIILAPNLYYIALKPATDK